MPATMGIICRFAYNPLDETCEKQEERRDVAGDCGMERVEEPKGEIILYQTEHGQTHQLALMPSTSDETNVVFCDSAFADDVARTNLTAIFQQHGLGNVRSL
jgi:hypothetical protein